MVCGARWGSLAVDSAGNLYVTDALNDRVVKVPVQ
jgi:hypothetical protein